MIRFFRLYKKVITFSFNQVTAYRASFLIFFLWLLVDTLVRVLFFTAVYSQVNSIGGWTFTDCFLLVMFHGLMYDFAWMFYIGGFSRFIENFSRGNFDFVLVKPINSLTYLTITGFNAGAFSGARFPLVAYAILFLPVAWHWPNALLAIAIFFLGVIILHALFVILSSLCFWLTEAESVFNFFFHVVEGGRYPYSTFPSMLRFVFTFFLPIFFFANFPVMVLRGMVSLNVFWLAVIMAIAAETIAYAIWSIGTRHYSSASS